jgi:hypothetical protein
VRVADILITTYPRHGDRVRDLNAANRLLRQLRASAEQRKPKSPRLADYLRGEP